MMIRTPDIRDQAVRLAQVAFMDFSEPLEVCHTSAGLWHVRLSRQDGLVDVRRGEVLDLHTGQMAYMQPRTA